MFDASGFWSTSTPVHVIAYYNSDGDRLDVSRFRSMHPHREFL